MFSSLIEALGVDGTFFIQFLIFLLFYPLCSRLLFRPYFKLNSQREKETSDRIKKAQQYQQKNEDLKKEYELRARRLSQQFNELYNTKSQTIKAELLKQYTAEQKKLTTEFQKKRTLLQTELKTAGEQLQSEVAPLAQTVKDRLLSNDSF